MSIFRHIDVIYTGGSDYYVCSQLLHKLYINKIKQTLKITNFKLQTAMKTNSVVFQLPAAASVACRVWIDDHQQ